MHDHTGTYGTLFGPTLFSAESVIYGFHPCQRPSLPYGRKNQCSSGSFGFGPVQENWRELEGGSQAVRFFAVRLLRSFRFARDGLKRPN